MSDEVEEVLEKLKSKQVSLDTIAVTHPEVLEEVKRYFTKQIIYTGFAVGTLDLSVVSFGLALQSIFHTVLAWFPISAILFTSSMLILKRVVS